MTKITKEGLKEEWDVLNGFFSLHGLEWLEYCEKHRNGKQDFEQLSALISSITSPNPWRLIVPSKYFSDLATAYKEYQEKLYEEVFEKLLALADKMDKNEKLVDGDA